MTDPGKSSGLGRRTALSSRLSLVMYRVSLVMHFEDLWFTIKPQSVFFFLVAWTWFNPFISEKKVCPRYVDERLDESFIDLDRFVNNLLPEIMQKSELCRTTQKLVLVLTLNILIMRCEGWLVINVPERGTDILLRGWCFIIHCIEQQVKQRLYNSNSSC